MKELGKESSDKELESIIKHNKALSEYFALKAQIEEKYGVKFNREEFKKAA